MMSTDPSADPGSPQLVSFLLHTIAQLLRETDRVDAQTQAALADLVDELSTTLESTQVSSAKIAMLTDSATQLVRAVHEQHEPGLLEAAHGRLQDAVVAAESEAPALANLTRRLAEILSNIGI